MLAKPLARPQRVDGFTSANPVSRGARESLLISSLLVAFREPVLQGRPASNQYLVRELKRTLAVSLQRGDQTPSNERLERSGSTGV